MFPRKSCPQCGSSDNVAVYHDGGEHCFSPDCGYHVFSTEGVPENGARSYTPTRLEKMGILSAIKDRKISQQICKKFGVTVDFATDGSVGNHYYPYYNTQTNEMTATKKRICNTEPKEFRWSGDRTDTGLFGQQTCRGGGKYITITEGEVDALAVSEMFDGKWDVVSIKDGASSAHRDISENLEFLETYDKIILCFDNDDAGLAAENAVKDLFRPEQGGYGASTHEGRR